MTLKQDQAQKLTVAVTQGFIQSLEILQMSDDELEGLIQEKAMENPLIEFTPPSTPFKPFMTQRGAMNIEDETCDYVTEGRINSFQDSDKLTDYLHFQTSTWLVAPDEKRTIQFLLGLVDSKGYLDAPESEIAIRLGVDVACVKKCLAQMRKLSPPGVCAENLQECLKAQLANDSIAKQIVDMYLSAVAAGHYSAISKALNIPISLVREKIEIIKKCNPIPSRGFSDRSSTKYVVPDVVIDCSESTIKVSMVRPYSSMIMLNPVYAEIDSDDDSVTNYVSLRLSEANEFIKNIRQRENTIMTIAKAIAERQSDFLLSSSYVIKPLSMTDISEQLQINISTVSRATKDRYIICRKGVFPLKLFFSSNLGEDNNSESQDSIQKAISKLISEEDKYSPLTDQSICSVLKQNGIAISRRTVAKYRDQMGIPSTHVRKVIS